MNDADMHIMCARFDHTLNAALSQVRVVFAHLVPVANGLGADSEEQRYLSAAMLELNALHGFIAQRLMELTTGISDPCEAGRALLESGQQCVAQMEAAAAVDSQERESSNGERSEISIH